MKKTLLFILCGIIFISCSRKSTPQSDTYETETEVETESDNRNSNQVAGLSSNWRYSYSTEKDAPQVVSYNDIPKINFNQSDNTVDVDGACNDLMANYSINGSRISFSDIDITNKKCDKPLEKYVFNFIKNVNSYKLQNNHLFLYHKGGNSRFIVFAKKTR